ncbi:DUF805 domain-containing protein [Stutzerimonas stutzeri]|uniref:DUF805 domain-containing protein n=1 Tax=Stutzerimonas sp. S1 TaxID=3030652 RepID=UPI0022252049|nr:DUF805 domain-containing protein [Stutzerimonas sp. S1]MCW3149603.1 DUF805 domain-containing protein [Stutzerimonas sp. S1]
MNETHYKILFSGDLMPGASADDVKDALARLFKTDRTRVEQLFRGGRVALKSGLRSDEADRYLAVLQRAGAYARKEPDQLSLEPLTNDEQSGSGAPGGDEAQMTCPKCGYTQRHQSECSACGIIIDKFLARQAQLAQSVTPPTGSGEHSPYAPPQATVSAPMASQGELRVFTIQGRIGRLRYLAWSLAVMFAVAGLVGIASIVMAISSTAGLVLMALLGIGAIVVNIQIGAQRLHDIGVSAWLLLLNLVPVLGAFVPLLMIAIPGKTGPNRYGPPQPPNSFAVKLLSGLWLLLVLVGIVLAITVPTVSQHLSLAGD